MRADRLHDASNRTQLDAGTVGIAAEISSQSVTPAIARSCGSLSEPEAALMSAINRHASVTLRLSEVLKTRSDLWEVSTRPKSFIILREAVVRPTRYPDHILGIELGAPAHIDTVFSRFLDTSVPEFFKDSREEVERDRQQAHRLFNERMAALDAWYDISGYEQVAQELEVLENYQERLEGEICDMPCNSIRMLMLKAAFGESLLRQNENDTNDGLLMMRLLRSMLPASEVQ